MYQYQIHREIRVAISSATRFFLFYRQEEKDHLRGNVPVPEIHKRETDASETVKPVSIHPLSRLSPPPILLLIRNPKHNSIA